GKPQRRSSPELGTEEIDVVAELAELRDMGEVQHDLQETVPASSLMEAQAARVRSGGSLEGTAELPSPEEYDQLVSSYLNAKNQDERRKIGDRLVKDSRNDHTVVRYYAVEAMAKLGRKSFGNALLAATEDVDDAVRMLAVEALKG
ncbi:MAG: hypothetical protein KC933_27110, partial [Myxococcales bacterium]|nr:hypothetical protein [Myxococcales bacterium]